MQVWKIEWLLRDTLRSDDPLMNLYLTKTPLEPKYFPKFDVLSYSKDRQECYPNLCRLACEVLSIPTIASEYAFSIGGKVLSKYRFNLLHNNQALILTQNWLHGFENICNLIYITFQSFLYIILILYYIIC